MMSAHTCRCFTKTTVMLHTLSLSHTHTHTYSRVFKPMLIYKVFHLGEQYVGDHCTICNFSTDVNVFKT